MEIQRKTTPSNTNLAAIFKVNYEARNGDSLIGS